jgi:hypothetical protein
VFALLSDPIYSRGGDMGYTTPAHNREVDEAFSSPTRFYDRIDKMDD